MGSNDYPLAECADVLESMVKDDPRITFFQKYSCVGCGNRLTIDKPNVLYTTGACDNCPAITDITKMGCNYVLVMPAEPKPKES